MAREERLCGLAMMTLAGLAGVAVAGPIDVPNGSFESPDVGGFYGFADAWQKPAVPAWWPGSEETWLQCSIVFANQPSGSPDHIVGLDGNQAASLFPVPGFALYQQLDGSNGVEAVYEVGKSYTLTVAVAGGGRPDYGYLTPGTQMAIALFYQDVGQTIALTPIVSTLTDGYITSLPDYTVETPVIQADDPWAGQPIGIALLPLSSSMYGYWDVDNVRLTSVPEPSALALAAVSGAMLLRRRRA